MGRIRTTNYGFEFEAATVERLASHNGYAIVGVKTSKQRLEITITPKGLIRVGKTVRNQEAAELAE